jgi:riboflavin kinase/FMN adenylyltransferase
LSLKVIKGVENYKNPQSGAVATVGTFDGLHLGHQAILKQLSAMARQSRGPALAITFEPHPRVLVTPDSPPPLLTCLNEKIRLFSQYLHDGILLVIDFDKGLMNLTADEFTREYLVEKLKIGALIVGYDHAFGKNRSGTINDLMGLSGRFSFALEIVNPVIVDGRPISSTRIRRLIADNRLNLAMELLNHPYPISGPVKKGILLGKKIGFPTANIDYNPRKLLPTEGVYSCSVDCKGRDYKGMMFIGKNCFDPASHRSVEVNIFDFNEDIYGQELYCFPEVYIRENRKYDDPEQLAKQLKIDKQNVLMLKQ